jgi:hypothetical protein
MSNALGRAAQFSRSSKQPKPSICARSWRRTPGGRVRRRVLQDEPLDPSVRSVSALGTSRPKTWQRSTTPAMVLNRKRTLRNEGRQLFESPVLKEKRAEVFLHNASLGRR